MPQPKDRRFFVIGELLLPLFTFVMSTYDGTLFALLLATLLLPILANFRTKRGAAPTELADCQASRLVANPRHVKNGVQPAGVSDKI